MNYISSVARYLYHKIPFVSSESKKSQPDPSKTVQTAAPYKKKHVPKTIRNQVWRKYCGNSLDSICYCCHQKLLFGWSHGRQNYSLRRKSRGVVFTEKASIYMILRSSKRPWNPVISMMASVKESKPSTASLRAKKVRWPKAESL